MTQSEQKYEQQITPEELVETTEKSGIFQLLGIKLDISQPGSLKVQINVDDRLFHAQQIVHGGVIFTLADTSMALALLAAVPQQTRVGTIEAKINFLHPVRSGELSAEAEIIHLGHSTAVMEATVHNTHENERLAVARVMGTFNLGRLKPVENSEKSS
ncbi:MAG TPA: PaaI family thioesterase [Ktedonobacteraceae bacterium]|nr:PaaI family thioesterase [Ktedonobacteraceae bacterium]